MVMSLESQIEACAEFLKSFAKPSKTIRPRMHSYTLKHAVEAWQKERTGDLTTYIHEDSLIEAAERLGFARKECSAPRNKWQSYAYAMRPIAGAEPMFLTYPKQAKK